MFNHYYFQSIDKFKADMIHLHLYRVIGIFCLGLVFSYLAAFVTGNEQARHAMVARRGLVSIAALDLLGEWFTIRPNLYC